MRGRRGLPFTVRRTSRPGEEEFGAAHFGTSKRRGGAAGRSNCAFAEETSPKRNNRTIRDHSPAGLRRIPRGETVSYAQLAQSLGQPTAVRAVARACATNPVAVVVPCHRVIGSNGKLTGYRWGIERKEKLLEMERLQRKG